MKDLVECCFGLGEAAEMEFGDGLGDERFGGGGGGGLGDFFEDVEGGLVGFAALEISQRVGSLV